MSLEALAVLSLLMAAIFFRGLWCLRRLYHFKTKGVPVTGRVVACDDGSENCTATIQYVAGGGVWTTFDRAETGEYRLGQEVELRYLSDSPSEGQLLDFHAWYEAWATVVLPVVAELGFVYSALIGAHWLRTW